MYLDFSRSYLEIPTINSEETLEFAVRDWDSWPNLPTKEPERTCIEADCFDVLIIKDNKHSLGIRRLVCL